MLNANSLYSQGTWTSDKPHCREWAGVSEDLSSMIYPQPKEMLQVYIPFSLWR